MHLYIGTVCEHNRMSDTKYPSYIRRLDKTEHKIPLLFCKQLRKILSYYLNKIDK